MGFINIGGQTVHASSIGITSSNSIISITNSTTTITSSSGIPYYVYGGSTINYKNSITYHVLGEDIEVEGYVDANLAVAISTLNVLGKPFYDELKKNNITLPKEIEEHLDIKFKILERERKINDVLK